MIVVHKKKKKILKVLKSPKVFQVPAELIDCVLSFHNLLLFFGFCRINCSGEKREVLPMNQIDKCLSSFHSCCFMFIFKTLASVFQTFLAEVESRTQGSRPRLRTQKNQGHKIKISTFQKKCCPRVEDSAIFEDLRPRLQGQGLDLRGQGQGLQNVSSRTSSSPRTSLRTPPLLSSVIFSFL